MRIRLSRYQLVGRVVCAVAFSLTVRSSPAAALGSVTTLGALVSASVGKQVTVGVEAEFTWRHASACSNWSCDTMLGSAFSPGVLVRANWRADRVAIDGLATFGAFQAHEGTTTLEPQVSTFPTTRGRWTLPAAEAGVSVPLIGGGSAILAGASFSTGTLYRYVGLSTSEDGCGGGAYTGRFGATGHLDAMLSTQGPSALIGVGPSVVNSRYFDPGFCV